MAPEKPNSSIEKTPEPVQAPLNISVDAASKLVQIDTEELEAKQQLPEQATPLDAAANKAKSAIESAAQNSKISLDQATLESAQRLYKLA